MRDTLAGKVELGTNREQIGNKLPKNRGEIGKNNMYVSH